MTLSRPDVHNAFDATLIGDLRTAFATLAREAPTQLRAVILAGDGPSFCAGADIDWMRAAMTLDTEGNEQDAMAMADMFEAIDICPVPVIARVHGAALGGGMGLCAVADVVIAESGTASASPRRGSDPAVGHQPVRRAKIGETHARALFPGGRRSTPPAPPGSGWSTRSSKARTRSTQPSTPRSRTCLLRADRGASGQGDRPRGPRPGPRFIQVAHGPGHRATADERGGPGGLPGLHREAASRLGTRSGRCLTQTAQQAGDNLEGGRRMMLLEPFRSPSGRAIRNAGPRDRDVTAGAFLSVR